jgi:hypothetical protein
MEIAGKQINESVVDGKGYVVGQKDLSVFE